MNKTLRVLAVLCIFWLTGGCGDVKDALDVEFDIQYNHTFTVRGDAATLSYDINLEDHEDYRKYKDKIRSTQIEYIRYSITSNTGGAGTCDFFAGNYGSAFPDATKVAQTIRFEAGETRGETDVEWINKAFLEGLLAAGKLSLWAVGTGSGIDVIVPVVVKVKVIANPLE